MTPTEPTTTTATTGDTAIKPLGARHLDTPVGRLTVVASSQGVRAVLWPVSGEHDRTGVGGVDDEGPAEVRAVLEQATDELAEYFAGDRQSFTVPLDPVGTEFQLAAWRALRTIEYATTVSYGEQAERMGDRAKARAVGAANGRNPISIIVPCHRVIGSDGALTGFAGGVEAKRWLLDHEARVAGTRLI